MVKVGNITQLIEEIAPSGAAYSFDNCGLLVGSENAEVKRVLFALEVSTEVIREAESKGCGLIVTHHPLVFRAEKSVTDRTYQGKLLLALISAGICLYSSHTPLDGAPGGCNDVLCDIFGVSHREGLDYMGNVGGRDYYCGRIGRTDIGLAELAELAQTRLGCGNVQVVRCKEHISTLAVCSGAGGGLVEECIRAGADCLLTGELSYHEALSLKEAGISAVICGHYETEIPVLARLIDCLQKRVDMLQYDVDLIKAESVTNPYLCLGGKCVDR